MVGTNRISLFYGSSDGKVNVFYLFGSARIWNTGQMYETWLGSCRRYYLYLTNKGRAKPREECKHLLQMHGDEVLPYFSFCIIRAPPLLF